MYVQCGMGLFNIIKANGLRKFNINYFQNSTLMTTVAVKNLLTNNDACGFDI